MRRDWKLVFIAGGMFLVLYAGTAFYDVYYKKPLEDLIVIYQVAEIDTWESQISSGTKRIVKKAGFSCEDCTGLLHLPFKGDATLHIGDPNLHLHETLVKAGIWEDLRFDEKIECVYSGTESALIKVRIWRLKSCKRI